MGRWGGSTLRPSSARECHQTNRGQYYRKDPSLFSKVDNLIGKGLSTDQVYNSIARAGASTVSEAIPGPKLIDNRKLLSKKETFASSSSKKKFKSVSGTGTHITQSCNLSFDFRSM